MEIFFAAASPAQQARERQKARKLRHSQWWRQQLGRGVCYHCRKKFNSADLTMDHLIPVARGGKSTRHNVVVACKACNSEKQNHTTFEMALARLRQHEAE